MEQNRELPDQEIGTSKAGATQATTKREAMLQPTIGMLRGLAVLATGLDAGDALAGLLAGAALTALALRAGADFGFELFASSDSSNLLLFAVIPFGSAGRLHSVPSSENCKLESATIEIDGGQRAQSQARP